MYLFWHLSFDYSVFDNYPICGNFNVWKLPSNSHLPEGLCKLRIVENETYNNFKQNNIIKERIEEEKKRIKSRPTWSNCSPLDTLRTLQSEANEKRFLSSHLPWVGRGQIEVFGHHWTVGRVGQQYEGFRLVLVNIIIIRLILMAILVIFYFS